MRVAASGKAPVDSARTKVRFERNCWCSEKWSGWNRTNRTGGYGPAKRL